MQSTTLQSCEGSYYALFYFVFPVISQALKKQTLTAWAKKSLNDSTNDCVIKQLSLNKLLKLPEPQLPHRGMGWLQEAKVFTYKQCVPPNYCPSYCPQASWKNSVMVPYIANSKAGCKCQLFLLLDLVPALLCSARVLMPCDTSERLSLGVLKHPGTEDNP